MTIGACVLSALAIAGASDRGSGISDDAHAVRRAAMALEKSVENSASLFGEKASALSQLAAVVNTAIDESREFSGADLPDPLAVTRAADLLRALPKWSASPEFSVQPDGSIELDWMPAKTRIFSISVSTSNRLAFSWLNGSEITHGVAWFDGSTVPAAVLFYLQAIHSDGSATLRAA